MNTVKKGELLPLILSIYLGFSTISSPIYRFIEWRRLASGKEDADRVGERMGKAIIPRPLGKLIWFHSASVGESLSLLNVIDGLLSNHPNLYILVTTTTVTSARILAERLPDRAIHQFCPYDTPYAVGGFLKHWRPDLAVWTESELWPRMMTETRNANIPMHLINARVSVKSAAVWKRWPRTIASLLNMFESIAVQESTTAELMQSVGVLGDKIAVTGSTKENAGPLMCDVTALSSLKSMIGGRPVWLAASTHEGEEQIVLQAHRQVIEQADSAALLLLVPRHPQRGAQIMTLVHDAGFKGAQRSLGDSISEETSVYVADTLGEMGLWYRLSPISFMGGSLKEVGGHNPFEPLALDSAVISGRCVFNFDEIYERLSRTGACQLINGKDDLAKCVLDLLNSKNRNRVILNARVVLNNNNDATSFVIKNLSSNLSV